MHIEPLTLKEKLLKDKRLLEFAEKQAVQNDPNGGGYWDGIRRSSERINAMLNW